MATLSTLSPFKDNPHKIATSPEFCGISLCIFHIFLFLSIVFLSWWPSTTLFWAQWPITNVWQTFQPTGFLWWHPYDIMTMTKRSDDDVQQSVKGGVASWENQDWWEDSPSQHEDNPAGQHHRDHEEGWYPDAQHLSGLMIIFFIVDVGIWDCGKDK